MASSKTGGSQTTGRTRAAKTTDRAVKKTGRAAKTTDRAAKASRRSRPERDLKERSTTYRWGRRKGQPKPHPRLHQRAAAVRRRPWWTIGILALVLALVGGVIYLFGFSSAFVVKEVTVAGAEGEIADGAREIATDQMGRPLARVDTVQVEERVLEDLRIDSVDVGRSWPATLTLDLTLREPALAIKQKGTGGVQLADRQGVVYESVSKAPKGMTVVSAPAGDLDPADLQAAQALPESLPPAIRKQMKGLQLTATGDMRFTIGHIQVTWGDGSNAELKAKTLEALLDQDGIDPDAETGELGEPVTIDVSTPSTAVVTGLDPEEPTS